MLTDLQRVRISPCKGIETAFDTSYEAYMSKKEAHENLSTFANDSLMPHMWPNSSVIGVGGLQQLGTGKVTESRQSVAGPRCQSMAVHCLPRQSYCCYLYTADNISGACQMVVKTDEATALAHLQRSMRLATLLLP